MTSLKTKNIWFLAAFLFLSIVPTLARVVNGVQDCQGFLHQETPPEIPGILVNRAIIQDQNNNNRYRVICQTYGGEPRFLTVYDTTNRIPVFSAYKYKGSEGGRPNVPWKIEPQLEIGGDPNDMMVQDQNINYNNQAVNADYTGNNQRYDRGHLFPVSHASGPDKPSTFTLTNAVPQEHNFNGGRWSEMEQCMKCIMDYYISRFQKKCFVVVGAKPGNNNLNNNNRNVVNIPSVMWSAFYCNDGTSRAYWSNNDADSPLHEGTLQELKDKEGIEAFPGTRTFINYMTNAIVETIRKYNPFGK